MAKDAVIVQGTPVLTATGSLKLVRRKVELAMVYADDGALHTGAKLLAEAAAEMEALAKRKDRALERLMGRR